MRQPNYRVGWYLPQRIAALTHFYPEVTAEDFAGVVQTGQELLQSASKEFHIVIDNRKIAMASPATLQQMKQMVPYMNHPLLRWVVVIKPQQLAIDTESLPIEQEGETRLKNVSSLAEGLGFLRQVAAGLDWQQADRGFFPDPDV